LPGLSNILEELLNKSIHFKGSSKPIIKDEIYGNVEKDLSPI
jgi:hypothetical protein